VKKIISLFIQATIHPENIFQNNDFSVK